METSEALRKVTCHCIASFNEAIEQKRLEYGGYSLKCYPITEEQIYERPVRGGMSAEPVERCRQMAMYVIAHHLPIWDHFGQKYRLLTNLAVAAHFHRTRQMAVMSYRRVCQLLQEDAYRSTYMDIISRMTTDGLTIWNLKKPHEECGKRA